MTGWIEHAARLEGIRLGLEAAAAKVAYWHDADQAIRRLDPETIAQLHQLAEEVLTSDVWVKGGDE